MKLDFKFEFSELSTADLNIDAIYKGGTKGNSSDDIFSKLLGLENSGGFRALKSRIEPLMLALVSSTEEPEWPDFLDIETGIFTYYGDNRTPGHTILDTPKKGNKCLENLFNWTHQKGEIRKKIPPIFIFIKEGKKGRDYRFRGLAVPGNPIFSQTEDLISVWKSKNGRRFQNYKAVFSILSIDKIKREWIKDIHNGNVFSDNCPAVWSNWINTGHYKVLKSLDERKIKTIEEQMPQEKAGKKLLGKKINYVFIGSCTNSRIEDFRAVAKIINGKKKSKNVNALIVPGSQQVAKQIIDENLDIIFKKSGFEIRQPGCSACLAMNEDKIPDGEYCVSTSNRNFEGRQGQGARTFLASPETAAKVAINGQISL